MPGENKSYWVIIAVASAHEVRYPEVSAKVRCANIRETLPEARGRTSQIQICGEEIID